MSILDKIIAVKKEEVRSLRSKFRISDFKNSEFFIKQKHSLLGALLNKNTISVIAEIKKASPSAGLIRSDFDHFRIAQIYARKRVEAISVLTDKTFFQGDISYLKDLAATMTLPLLCKDFIIDEYQLYEAKSYGADAVLLIAEVLSESQIKELSHAAQEIKLEILLELHCVEQIKKIDFEQIKMVGINNRNLDNFSVNISTTAAVKKHLPVVEAVVSESGICTQEDVNTLKRAQIDAILVGEHLMRSNDIGRSLDELKTWCDDES
jgi:indole-3-glycerol phosphate synthase